MAMKPLADRNLQILTDIWGREGGPSMVVSTRWTGIPRTKKALRNYYNILGAAAERGVRRAMKYLLVKTLEVTPEDTGELKKSGDTLFWGKGMNIKGAVVFGAPYAIYVHEDLNNYHKPPTEAKFLQRTQYRLRGKISQIIAEECSKATIRVTEIASRT